VHLPVEPHTEKNCSATGRWEGERLDALMPDGGYKPPSLIDEVIADSAHGWEHCSARAVSVAKPIVLCC